MGLAALGFALSAPTVGWAQEAAPSPSPPAANMPQHTHRRNIFGREILCTECLRAREMARSGKYIPPAPPLPPTDDGKPRNGFCLNCVQGGTVAAGTVTGGQVVAGVLMPGPVVPGGPVAAPVKIARARNAPGRAVVGGDAPGYASVGGEAMLASEPTPIGPTMMTQAWANARRPAPNQPPRPSADSAVTPTSFNPVPPQGSNNPHILRHLFGLDAIGSAGRREAERRAREKHASIAYDQKEQKVTELPASMVYSKR
jgi:hypothetical protein